MKILLETYLQYLYNPLLPSTSKEWRGHNLPVEGDEKPNWIRECMVLENDRMKINCLRRLREQTAMNPFYQYRIDRFIDAITGSYEASVEPGILPGNDL